MWGSDQTGQPIDVDSSLKDRSLGTSSMFQKRTLRTNAAMARLQFLLEMRKYTMF